MDSIKRNQFLDGKYLVLTSGPDRGLVRFQVPMEVGEIKSPSGNITKRMTLVEGVFKRGNVAAQRKTGLGNVQSELINEVADNLAWRSVAWSELKEELQSAIARRSINLITAYPNQLDKASRKELYRNRAKV